MGMLLNSIVDFFSTLWNQIVGVFSTINLVDVLDIIAVAFIIYKGIQLVRETRAQLLLKGIVILLVIFLLAQWLDMVSLTWLLTKLFDYAIIAVVIIFQPEIRRALERMGRSNLSTFGFGQTPDERRLRMRACIDAVCKASQTMQDQKVGALMVFERSTPLGEIINTGTVIDAAPTQPLICNVFYPKSPLHDGAMILRAARVHAAGCILPLTPNTELSRELGTRHRAAIGMSENSDAVVVVVSEETGNISIAVNGVITRGFNGVTLRAQLETYLLDDEDETDRRRLLDRFKKRGGKKHGT